MLKKAALAGASLLCLKHYAQQNSGAERGVSNAAGHKLHGLWCAIPYDSALTTAGAKLFLAANWSLTAKFDGEFASGAQTYAGSGTLRYTW